MPPMRPSLLVALLLGVMACQEYAESTLTPAQKKKAQAHILTNAPTPQHTIGAIIEDQVKLLGYDIDKTKVKPGESFTVTYYLEMLAEHADDNKIFVHFQGRKNDPKAWMNLDHHPVDGLLPLRQLTRGQVVKDVQTIKVRPDFPGGTAKVYWGLWRGDHRLKIINADAVPHDKEGRVIVASVQVDGPRSARPRLPAVSATRLAEGEAITIDGKLDEPAWARARPTPKWTSSDGKNRPVPKTTARLAWTPTHLYIGVESDDNDVWSTFTDRDSNTWEQEVIEVFIDADGDKKDYLELQVSPANVVFDARFERHRSDLAKARAWNMAGFESAARVDGSLNQRDDTDRGWTVEMAIPVAQVPGAKSPIAHGHVWRANLFRWDFPKGKRATASAFSPPVVGDFHALAKFGRLRFVDPQQKNRPAIKLRRALPTPTNPAPQVLMPKGGLAPEGANTKPKPLESK